MSSSDASIFVPSVRLVTLCEDTGAHPLQPNEKKMHEPFPIKRLRLSCGLSVSIHRAQLMEDKGKDHLNRHPSGIISL